MPKINRRAFCSAMATLPFGQALAESLALKESATPKKQSSAELLDKDIQLRRFHFWQNRDWEWYRHNIPFFESPEPQIDEIYYYRWEVVTRHLRYTSPDYGYIITEFFVDPTVTWAGRYQSICGAADLHIDDVRWMKSQQPARDYLLSFLTVPGARPRAYGFAPTWVADALARVQGGDSVFRDHLSLCIENYEGWERGYVQYPNDNGYEESMGLFWTTGRDMGSEFNLASAQLSDELSGQRGYKIRGGAGFRPDINAVLYAEAKAIAELAEAVGDRQVTARFAQKAASIKENTQKKLWDPEREFFIHRWRYNQYADGDEAGRPSIRAGSLLWETNAKKEGVGFQPNENGAGREIFCYHLWRYGLPDDNDDSTPATGYARAWRFLTLPEYFAGRYGPRTGERHDPWYSVIYGECRHNGQTWPYHTARILAGGAVLLNDYRYHTFFSRKDWVSIFRTYTELHRNGNMPFVAESHDPDQQRWTELRPIGFHYFHSSYVDLVITGLAGIRPRRDNILEINPLAPKEWDYFALDDVLYHGNVISIFWDRYGSRYHRGTGFHVYVNGVRAFRADEPGPCKIVLSRRELLHRNAAMEKNYAVNAENLPYPKALASHSGDGESPEHAINGCCWYDMVPANRWTSRGSKNQSEWFELQFGQIRTIQRIELALYDDDYGVAAPHNIALESWHNGEWRPIDAPVPPLRARCTTTIPIPTTSTERLRMHFFQRAGNACGLVSLAAWGTS